MVNSCHCGKQWLSSLLFIAVDISFRTKQHLLKELSALSSLNRCSKSCTLDTVDQFIGEEMNRISAHCVPQIRDGLIGPEEIKVSGAVLYEIDRLGVSLLLLITLPKLTVTFCCCSDWDTSITWFDPHWWWTPRCCHSGHHLSTSDKQLCKHIIGWLSLAVLILSRSLIWSNACCFFPITFVQKRELYSKSVRNLTTFSSQPLTGWIDLLLRIYLDQIYVPKPLS